MTTNEVLKKLASEIASMTDAQKAKLLAKLDGSPTPKKTCKFTYNTVKMTQVTTCLFCGTQKTETYNVDVLASEVPQDIIHSNKVPWCMECETSEDLMFSDKRVIIAKAIEVIKSLQRGEIK